MIKEPAMVQKARYAGHSSLSCMRHGWPGLSGPRLFASCFSSPGSSLLRFLLLQVLASSVKGGLSGARVLPPGALRFSGPAVPCSAAARVSAR
jgi:hypothetical protein